VRLSSFIGKPEGINAASDVVSHAVGQDAGNIGLRRLYAWLLINEHRYNDALEQYHFIDRTTNAHGNELFNFGQQLAREHAYATAATTFKEIIDQQQNPPMLPYARFEYAQALEALKLETDSSGTTMNNINYDSLIDIYNSILAEHPSPDITAKTFLRIGGIKFNYLSDLEGAAAAYTRAQAMAGIGTVPWDATIKLGDVQLVRNDLDEAEREYTRAASAPVTAYQDQAAFKLAELAYYRGMSDSAMSLLKRFNTNLNTDLTNDALELQYFIQENINTAPQALKEFAGADLQMTQRRYPESLAHFQDIVKRYPQALLVDDAMMKIGELQIQLKHPQEAIATFRFVIDSIQMSIFKDRAQMRIAEIYQYVLRNPKQAIDAYEQLLAQFPNSLYAEESRKRIRTLRGDAP